MWTFLQGYANINPGQFEEAHVFLCFFRNTWGTELKKKVCQGAAYPFQLFSRNPQLAVYLVTEEVKAWCR